MVPIDIPEDLVGQFFGVGSVGEDNPHTPLQYVQDIYVPYAYQIPNLHEEDMIRQFGSLVEGFEDDGNFILDVDIHTYREITEEDDPLLPEKKYFHSMYLLFEEQKYRYFKMQTTAPATMCFSTRGSDGKQLVSPQMFRFYSSLMKRIAQGLANHIAPSVQNTIHCQDDPSLGYFIELIDSGQAGNLTVKHVVQSTDNLYPDGIIPAYHYCDDWRDLERDGWYILWDSRPKIMHIDLVSYKPILETEQAEKINQFFEKGGGLALGVLPNIDDGFSDSVIEVLKRNLGSAVANFVKSGVSIELLGKASMISTQCGLSRASSKLTREIHSSSHMFPEIFVEALSKEM